ncbi:MAG: FAD-dependent oxidoreductase, partial [Pseudomonadota bacterium]
RGGMIQFQQCRLPLLYDHGLYIVPHVGGTVAVGSTSEKQFDAPDDTDAQLDDLIQRARSVCPALADAPVIERWAGVRPKPPGREPVIGPIPGTRHWMATGGFKIGFGIAHLAGDILVEIIRQEQPSTPLPETFLPVSHLAN